MGWAHDLYQQSYLNGRSAGIGSGLENRSVLKQQQRVGLFMVPTEFEHCERVDPC